MNDIKRTVDQLLREPNPQARSFAIDLLIRNSSIFDADRLLELLKTASLDENAAVSEKAKLSMSKLLKWGFKKEQEIRALGIHSRLTTVSQQQLEQELMLRQGAEEPLKAVMWMAREHARRPESPFAGLALEVLGRSRSLEHVGDLIHATTNPGLRDKAYDALFHFHNAEAVSLLAHLLESNRDEQEAGRIAEVLGRLGFEDGVGPLEMLSGHASPAVREKVAHALGGIKHPLAEKLLLAMLEDPANQGTPAILLELFGSIGKIGKKDAGERLIALLRSIGEPKLYSSLLATLGVLHNDKSLPLILDGIKHPNARVRANAIEALSNFALRPEDAVMHLAPAMQDRNNRVRANAIVALYPYDPGRAVMELKAMLASKKGTERASGLWVVGEIQDVEVIDAYTVVLNTEQERVILQAGLSSLERFKNPRLKPGVYPLLFHANPSIKIAAIRAYARLSGPGCLKELDGLYDVADSDNVRLTILRCMGDLCEPGSTRFLAKRLKETNASLVGATVEGLDQVGSIENTVLLEPYAAHPHPLIRSRAIVALWRMGNLGAPSGLLEMLQARDEATTRHGLEALCELQESMNWTQLRRRPMLLSALSSHVRSAPESETSQLQRNLPRLTGRISLDESHIDEVSLARAMNAFCKGEEARAREYVEEILGRQPEHEGALYLQQRIDRAVGKSRAIPKRVLEQTGFLNLISEESRRAKELQDTERLLESYFLIFERQMEILKEYVELGRLYLSDGNVGRSTDIAKLIVSQMQWTQDLNQKLGLLYMERKEYETAFAHLMKAFLSSGGEPVTGVNLAAVSLKLRKREVAKSILSWVMNSSLSDARVKALAREVGKDLQKSADSKVEAEPGGN